MLFTGFNSAVGYSGPAALRVLRASGGQETNGDLYNPAPEGCYLFEDLRKAGYRTFTALNHDGVYGNFAKEIVTHGKADPPMSDQGIAVRQLSFDKSPVYDDFQVLDRWLQERNKSGAKRAALYFNTITLHAGSHRAGEKNWWLKSRDDHYKEALLGLIKDMDRFFGELAASGRNYVVIFVPEHGAALRGSSIQSADLRDIPLPSITRVPVGIKLIGPGFAGATGKEQVISKPTSYLALAYVISEMLKNVPISRIKPADIPETPYVSENQENRIVRIGDDYYLNGADKNWVKLPASAIK